MDLIDLNIKTNHFNPFDSSHELYYLNGHIAFKRVSSSIGMSAFKHQLFPYLLTGRMYVAVPPLWYNKETFVDHHGIMLPKRYELIFSYLLDSEDDV
jgi:hypothetical protein